MAAVEIDDAELATLQAGKKLLEQINGDPKTRSLLTKAIKAHYPNTRTDEDVAAEVAQPYIERVEGVATKLQEQLDALTAERTAAADARAKGDMSSAFDRLRQTYGYNDDGIDRIQKLMIERNIADPEAAAALHERLNPTPAQTRSSWEPDSWNLKEDAVDHDVAGLFSNPDLWADKRIGQILMEERTKAA